MCVRRRAYNRIRRSKVSLNRLHLVMHHSIAYQKKTNQFPAFYLGRKSKLQIKFGISAFILFSLFNCMQKFSEILSYCRHDHVF